MYRTSTAFPSFQMQAKYPEAFARIIRRQTETLSNNHVIILNDVSEDTMYYLAVGQNFISSRCAGCHQECSKLRSPGKTQSTGTQRRFSEGEEYTTHISQSTHETNHMFQITQSHL